MADSDTDKVFFRDDDSDGEVTFPRFEDMDQWRPPFASQMGTIESLGRIDPGQGFGTGDEDQTEGEPESENELTVKADSQAEIGSIRDELRRSAERFEREGSVVSSTPIISVRKDPDADIDENSTSGNVRVEIV